MESEKLATRKWTIFTRQASRIPTSLDAGRRSNEKSEAGLQWSHKICPWICLSCTWQPTQMFGNETRQNRIALSSPNLRARGIWLWMWIFPFSVNKKKSGILKALHESFIMWYPFPSLNHSLIVAKIRPFHSAICNHNKISLFSCSLPFPVCLFHCSFLLQLYLQTNTSYANIIPLPPLHHQLLMRSLPRKFLN